MSKKVVHPGVILSKMLDEREVSQRDFASMIDVAYPIVNNILKGTRNINVNFAISLEAAGYGKASDWLSVQMEYSLLDARKDETVKKKNEAIKTWSKIKEIVPLNYFIRQEVGIQSSEDLDKVYTIYGVKNFKSLEERINDFNPTYFRKSSKFTENKNNIVAWSLMAKFKAKQFEVKKFSRQSEGKLLAELKKCFYEGGDVIEKSTNILGEFGIKFFTLDRPSQTPVDGKSFMCGSNPTIVLSLKYKRLDNFAFTLFHEIGHVFEHLTNPNRPEFKEEEFFINNNKNTEIVEFEANTYATNNLIDPNKFNDFILLNDDFSDDVIFDFAKKNEVHPAIIWGRICHEFPEYYRKRSSVRALNIIS